MTDTTPAAIAALLEGVTEGPWDVDWHSGMLDTLGDVWRSDEDRVCENASNPDARFIAWCREGVPALAAQRDDAIRAKDCFQRATRAHWEALCAMRNSINEYIPMPNTDSGPLFSPEDGPIYADIAERVVTEVRRMKCLKPQEPATGAITNGPHGLGASAQDAEERDTLRAELAAAQARAAELTEAAAHALHDIDDLINNSEGVAGLHQNGDIAEWESLLEGGAFGAWLCSLETLRAALTKETP